MKVIRCCDDCGGEVIMQHYPHIAKIGDKVLGFCENCNRATLQTLKRLDQTAGR